MLFSLLIVVLIVTEIVRDRRAQALKVKHAEEIKAARAEERAEAAETLRAANADWQAEVDSLYTPEGMECIQRYLARRGLKS